METLKINGIVVSVTKYKDFDALCSILTDNGIKKVKFSGVRRPNAKMAFASQPFFCGEFLLSGAKDYAVVTSVAQSNDFFNITRNYEAYILGASMLKIAQKIATNDTSELLQLVMICLATLQLQNIDILVVENYFNTKILQFLGVWSSEFCCALCGKDLSAGAILDAQTGALFCKNCADENGVVISSNVCAYLKNIATKSLSEQFNLQESVGVKTKANEILKKLIESQT